jgi:hypothetical protein
MVRWSVFFPAFATAAALLGAVPAARADDATKAACLASFDEGQKLRLDGKLGAAREQLLACSRAECPGLVRDDCVRLVDDVNRSRPSVVFAAKDDEGKDLVAVKVTVDGTVVSESLDGKPLELDPGAHRVRYEASGYPAVDGAFVARSGEKLRRVDVTFRAPHVELAPAEPPPAHRAKVAGWVLAGVGVAALLGAGVVDAIALRDEHDLRTGCAPACAESDVDAVRTKYIVAGAVAGVGVVAVAAGAWLLLSSPSSRATSARGVFFDVRPSLAGAEGAIGARF